MLVGREGLGTGAPFRVVRANMHAVALPPRALLGR